MSDLSLVEQDYKEEECPDTFMAVGFNEAISLIKSAQDRFLGEEVKG